MKNNITYLEPIHKLVKTVADIDKDAKQYTRYAVESLNSILTLQNNGLHLTHKIKDGELVYNESKGKYVYLENGKLVSIITSETISEDKVEILSIKPIEEWYKEDTELRKLSEDIETHIEYSSVPVRHIMSSFREYLRKVL